MFVNDKVRIGELKRQQTPTDRSAFVGQEGLLIQRLNVPWEPELGALWKVRFADRTEETFAEAEIAVLDASGAAMPDETESLIQTWGDAPRAGSMPFRRRLSSASAQAVLAFIVLCLAGLLLIGAGIAQGDLRISAAGGALVLVGLGAVATMVA